jgi:hypothetical protein
MPQSHFLESRLSECLAKTPVDLRLPLDPLFQYGEIKKVLAGFYGIKRVLALVDSKPSGRPAKSMTQGVFLL